MHRRRGWAGFCTRFVPISPARPSERILSGSRRRLHGYDRRQSSEYRGEGVRAWLPVLLAGTKGRDAAVGRAAASAEATAAQRGATRAFSYSASPRGNCPSSTCWSGTGCSRSPFFVLAKLLWRLESPRLDARRPHRARHQERGVRHPAGGDRHLHRRRTTARSAYVGRAHGQAQLRARHQHPVHPQHVRAVHPLFHRQCRRLRSTARRGGAQPDHPHRPCSCSGASCSGSAITTIRICAPSASASRSIRRWRSMSGSSCSWCSASRSGFEPLARGFRPHDASVRYRFATERLLPSLLPMQDRIERPHEHQDVEREIVPDHGADEELERDRDRPR